MKKPKYICPSEGTLEVLINQNNRIHLLHVLLEAGEDDRFIKEFKDVMHPTSSLNTAITKITSQIKDFEHFGDLLHDAMHSTMILSNAAIDNKLHAWRSSEKKKEFLLTRLDDLTREINKLKEFKQKHLKHCKIRKAKPTNLEK